MKIKAEITLRKLKQNEVIEIGDLHSLNGFGLNTIKNKETIGQTPAQFDVKREFYRVESINEIENVRG